MGAGVKKEWFYGSGFEKNKFNWFLFEAAREYENAIAASDRLAGFRKKHSSEEIARYCEYFVKKIMLLVMDKPNGTDGSNSSNKALISGFFAGLSDSHVKSLLDAAFASWGNLLSICGTCPSRCLSEKDQPAVFFDDPFLD
jgi:hypothetical protein